MRNINIEIKAKIDSHDKIRKLLKNFKAEYIGIDFQTDTFFNVRNGSLKLREGNLEDKLVYEEIDVDEKKKVLLYHTHKNSSLKEILEKTYGIAEVVEKHREVYSIENVRFYIDFISTKGSYLGIEARGRNNSHTKEELQSQIDYYISLFQLTEWKYIQNSYTDMVDQLTSGDSMSIA